MHWTAPEAGNLDDERALILLEQEPGDVCVLSAAPSDLGMLAQHWAPAAERVGIQLRLGDARPLRRAVAADDWVRKVARRSRLIILRLLGGGAYFPYLMNALERLPARQRPRIWAMPGTEQWDADLPELNGNEQAVTEQLRALLAAGGPVNLARGFALVHAALGGPAAEETTPETVPAAWEVGLHGNNESRLVWVISYRARVLAADSDAATALIERLVANNCQVRHLAVYSFREDESRQFLAAWRLREQPQQVLCLHGLAAQDADPLAGLPVLQVVEASSDGVAWRDGAGLSPADIASKVAMPELDGRVLTGIASFKVLSDRDEQLCCQLERQRTQSSQIEHITQQVMARFRLTETARSDRRIAVVLANYPTSDARVGNGVGLDTPASAVALLQALAAHGYSLADIPHDGRALMAALLAGVTNDPDSVHRPVRQQVAGSAVQQWLQQHAPNLLDKITAHWGAPAAAYAVAGWRTGCIFLGIQPPPWLGPGPCGTLS